METDQETGLTEFSVAQLLLELETIKRVDWLTSTRQALEKRKAELESYFKGVSEDDRWRFDPKLNSERYQLEITLQILSQAEHREVEPYSWFHGLLDEEFRQSLNFIIGGLGPVKPEAFGDSFQMMTKDDHQVTTPLTEREQQRLEQMMNDLGPQMLGRAAYLTPLIFTLVVKLYQQLFGSSWRYFWRPDEMPCMGEERDSGLLEDLARKSDIDEIKDMLRRLLGYDYEEEEYQGTEDDEFAHHDTRIEHVKGEVEKIRDSLDRLEGKINLNNAKVANLWNVAKIQLRTQQAILKSLSSIQEKLDVNNESVMESLEALGADLGDRLSESDERLEAAKQEMGVAGRELSGELDRLSRQIDEESSELREEVGSARRAAKAAIKAGEDAEAATHYYGFGYE